jgi:uncharacterized damage-inducible protein DinB
MSESATRPAAESGISFDALLRYNELETARWREWFKHAPPSVLDIPAGDPALWMESVRGLLFHIFLVEWVYAKTLHGRGWDGWDSLDRTSLDGVFAIADEAQPLLRSFAESATSEQLARHYSITAKSGETVGGSGRKFLAHIVLHSTRHWAQVATLLRQAGHKTDWQHDFVMSNAIE